MTPLRIRTAQQKIHQKDTCGFKADRQKTQVTARLGHIWPEEWSRMSKDTQRKAINQWAEDKIGRCERTRHVLNSGR